MCQIDWASKKKQAFHNSRHELNPMDYQEITHEFSGAIGVLMEMAGHIQYIFFSMVEAYVCGMSNSLFKGRK